MKFLMITIILFSFNAFADETPKSAPVSQEKSMHKDSPKNEALISTRLRAMSKKMRRRLC